jgi:hypothetical protein
MKRILILAFVVAAELAGCYAGVRGCGCGHRDRGGFDQNAPGAGCGCGCG